MAFPHAVVAESLTGSDAIVTAQTIADRNGAPVAVLEGWQKYIVVEDDEQAEEAVDMGWAWFAVVDPQEVA